jgi:quinol monooxygenase YgiN
MYIVTVTFQVKPAYLAQFMPAMVANADESLLREPDCHQFDVCVSLDDPHRIFLYEVYESSAAFQVHLGMPHFKAFSQLTADWVESKVVSLYDRP